MSLSSPTGLRTGSASSSRSDEAAPAARRKPGSRAARKLFRFDRALGVRFVAGADEAGRGCLAGPLVAAAVLFDLERIGVGEVRALTALNDSKQQTPEGRAELFPIILRVATKVAIVSRCAPGIDARGLHVTNLAALRDALSKVACHGCVCLSDGFRVAALGHDQRAVVDGDAKSAAIAAASVIAKETRDRYMRRADSAHPGWEFAQHVGYSTPEHREAIERLGVSPLHRLSFQSMAYQQLAFAEHI
ncbi:MAG: ribonuclease HII [Solirubrobacterales bacterium]|nr:ribonuclease HII [Solirubrobacterales bacterium]